MNSTLKVSLDIEDFRESCNLQSSGTSGEKCSSWSSIMVELESIIFAYETTPLL